jgi:hypothetical protein
MRGYTGRAYRRFFPRAEIGNGVLTAKPYLPDSENGYYRGTRFDWPGNMPSLEYASN